MYTVGRLARRFGLSRSTLLYYDRIGLLRPAAHAPGDYRHYSEDDARRLQRICMFRDAGLSLAAIARALEAPDKGARKPQDHPALATILEERLEELHREMTMLRNQRTLIAGLLGLDDLPGETPLTQETWTALLAKAGYSDEAMHRWHADFERTAPEAHARFLSSLGIAPARLEAIRSWARALSSDSTEIGPDDIPGVTSGNR